MKLSAKFGLLVTAAAVIAGLVLGGLIYRQVSVLLERDAINEQVATAQGVLAKIGDALSYAQRDMRILAGDEFLKLYVGSPGYRTPVNQRLLQSELRTRGEYTGPWYGLSVFDAKRGFLLSTDPYAAIRTLENPVVAIAYRTAMSGRFYGSSLVEPGKGGEKTLIFAAPILAPEDETASGTEDQDKGPGGGADEGQVIGVMLAQYRWPVIAEEIARAAPPEGGIYLLDALGHVIARHGAKMSGVHGAGFETGDELMRASSGSLRHEVLHARDASGRTMLSTHVVMPGSNASSRDWSLVIEQPESMIFAPAQRLAWQAAWTVVGVMLLLALIVTLFGYRLTRPLNRLARIAEYIGRGDYRERVHYGGHDEVGTLAASFNAMAAHLQAHEAELVAARQRIQGIVETVPGVLYTASPPGLRLTFVSQAAEPLLGFGADDFAADPGLRGRLIVDEDRERVLAQIVDAKKTGEDFVLNYRMRHRDGRTVRWIEDRGRWERDEQGEIVGLFGLMTDISKRKEREQALAKANRALNLMQSYDRLLARAGSESEWVHGVCEGLVDGDVYTCVWIGLLDPARPDQPVRVAAYLGADAAFVAQAAASSEPAQDLLPHNYAMRERRACVIGDLIEMGATEIWAQRALDRGFACMVSLPLIGRDGVLGALTLYSAKLGVFDEQEVALLEELSGNLAYGLDILRERTRQTHAVVQV